MTGVHVASNLIFAFLGNLVGAGLFVGGGSWYLYLQGRPAAEVPAVATDDAAARSTARPRR